MSKVLAALSGKAESEIKNIISELEDRSGYPSEDARFLAEHAQALHSKISQLGLDPDDTTGPELYHALIARYERDAKLVDRAVGVSPESSAEQRLEKAKQLVEATVDGHEVWALKKTAAKSLISQFPPKKLMKKLGYRSVDSLIKREDTATILIGADICESATWHKAFTHAVAKLGTEKYELRSPRIISFKKIETGELVVVNGLAGAVAVSSQPPNTMVLTIALNIFEGLESLSENQLQHELHSANPALSWWSDTHHLLAFNDGQPVSLNFKDVARNHLLNNDFDSRSTQNAHSHVWKSLMNRYKDYIDELPVELAAAEKSAAQTFKPKLELMPETVEV